MNSTNNQVGINPFWQSGSIRTAALGATFAGLLAFIFAPQPPHDLPMVVPEITEITVEPVTPARDVMRAAFFDQEVQPRIAEADELNRQAADRCVQRLRSVIDRYRDGVAPFVEDLTSMSTRLGIARRLPGDWWKDDKRIETYVQKKFEHHLFSKETLMNDIAKVLDDFRADVDANQKRMLVQIHASLTTADLPEVNLDEYEPFFESVATQLKNSSAQGTDSVYRGLTILVASEVGSYVSVTIVAGLLARFGTAAAATAAVGVGATAGAAATGAGGGSLAGPVGTVVGLGVGLAVGLLIDWWMTEQFEEKMVNQMRAYLDSLEAALLAGSAAASDLSPPESTMQCDGVADALPVLCDQLLTAYRERFFEQIVTVQQP